MRKSILFLLLTPFILVFVAFAPTLFQEGNPLPVIAGIIKIEFSSEQIAKFSGSPVKYVSRASAGKEPLVELMKRKGWKFRNQLGAGYIFQKTGDRVVIVGVKYTRRYMIWKYPQLE